MTFEPRPAICTGTPAFDLWVIDRAGIETRLVGTSGADGFADWSPNGGRLAFVSSRDGSCGLFVIDADGSGLVTIAAGYADELYPSWSPDGSKVVFPRYGQSGAQLWVVDVDTGDENQVTDSDLLHDFPDWSPDGESLVFAGGTEEVHEIYRLSLTDGDETALTARGRLVVAPEWSANGRQIAYFDHTDTLAVWVMSSDGSDQRRVTEGGHMAWSPDGESLVLDREVAPGGVDLFVDDELLVDGPGLDTLPAWPPNGDLIVFSSDRP